MLSQTTLYRFKNHGELRFPIAPKLVISGGNGVGKTNILEAIYTSINASPPPGRTFFDLIEDSEGAAFVRSDILSASGLTPQYTISFASDTRKVQCMLQWAVVTRPKYLASHGLRAMLFLPIEMNLLYLGPSLRRDFLDETLLLTYEPFAKLKREYSQVLRSRNALLKRISEWKSPPSDLDAWDLLFAQKASTYFEYRMAFLEFLESKMSFITEIVGSKYHIRAVYETKIDRTKPLESIKHYNADHREKDILVGHTCIGPHLDDLFFEVQTRHGWVRTEEFLSRWENKSILLALKLLSIEFLEKASNTKTVLLLDDITSELDEAHVQKLFDYFNDRPYILTGHTIPESIRSRPGTVNMYLNENSRFV